MRIAIPALPDTAISCNCSICRRLATLWGYWNPKDVRIVGETDGYEWGDHALSLRRCKTCGCVTHWQSLDPKSERMGVNLRNFDPKAIAGVPVRRLDGADTWEFLD